MNNLKYISNSKLDENLKSLVATEREVLSEILLHIVEVDLRKLYLKMAYPSLFEYLTKHIGYSAGSAQRRIDAARLSREVPEVITQLEAGTLNLSQVSLLQKSIRQTNSNMKKQFELDGVSAVSLNSSEDSNNELSNNKIKTTKVSKETKQSLVNDLINKSFRQSEVLIKQALNIDLKKSPQISHQKDESVRLELTLTKSQWEKLNKMRDLLSHSLPDGSWDQVLEYVSDKVIQQKDKAKKSVRINKQKSVKVDTNPRIQSTNVINEVTKNGSNKSMPYSNLRKSIPMDIQRAVFKRDQCCQYIDKVTKRKCTATWQLAIDHIKPVWANGDHDLKNLRVLCANHNRENYRLQTNLRQR